MSPDWEKIIAQAAERTRTDTAAAQNAATASNSPSERGLHNIGGLYRKPLNPPYTPPAGPHTRKEAFRAAFDFMERHALSTSAPVPCSLDYWNRVHQDMVQASRVWQGNSFAEDLFVAVFCELEREYTEASQPEEQNS